MADKRVEVESEATTSRGKPVDSVVIRISVDEKASSEESISNWSQSLNFNPSGLIIGDNMDASERGWSRD